MAKSYSLSVKALLYLVSKRTGKQLSGFQNIHSMVSLSDYPMVDIQVKEEMYENGCASLDFSGNMTLNKDFEQSIVTCANAEKTLIVTKKSSEAFENCIIYKNSHDNKNCSFSVVEMVDQSINSPCRITLLNKDEIIEYFCRIAAEICINDRFNVVWSVNSEYLYRYQKEELARIVGNPEIEQILADSIQGKGKILSVCAMDGTHTVVEMSAILSDMACFLMEVEYEIKENTYESVENIIFKSSNRATVLDNIMEAIGLSGE